ncbi:helix-turn-helix domain-containing protein [Celeribacter sp.]|uniref:helix-turn-helix domain-containing protein n=1 Tax=Celeribacter sp. TaxID=1890673 RepID=UPI003A94B637
MDKSEHFSLVSMPMDALRLKLARSPIPMVHGPEWSVDKVVPVHDLIMVLEGKALYEIEGTTFEMEEGEALLIPSFTRFRGRFLDGHPTYKGMAQHFTLNLFNRGDVISTMNLSYKARFKNWDNIKPIVELCLKADPDRATDVSQHHQFMVILLAFLDEAFQSWKDEPSMPTSQDQLSVHIIMVASQLASDPLGYVFEETLAEVPYNKDYFRRAFRDRIGMTPQKYREQKRMEYAIRRLDMGLTVKQVAEELGYSDPYFFSRQFKRHIGASPSQYRARPSKWG